MSPKGVRIEEETFYRATSKVREGAEKILGSKVGSAVSQTFAPHNAWVPARALMIHARAI